MNESIDQDLVDYFEGLAEICHDRLGASSVLFEDLRNYAARGELDTRNAVKALSNVVVTLETRIASLEIAAREDD